MADPILTDRELDELTYHLDHLVRPGTGALGPLAGTAVRYLSGILGAEGVPCEVVEAEGGRPCLLARLSAHRPDESLLVVAASDPPAGADVSPRRALEGRVAAAAALMALALVRRRGLVPQRDLVLAVLPGRDPDGAPVLRHLAATHRDRLRCRLVLTADGTAPCRPGRRTLVGVQVAAKAWVRVRIATTAAPAHNAAGAPARLLRVLLPLESGTLGIRPCAPALAWLDAVASTLPPRPATLLRGVQLLGAGPLLSRLVPDRDLAATLAQISRDTAQIVGLRAGPDSGLPPDRAEADVVLRILPGRPADEAVRDLAALLGDEAEVQVADAVEAVEMPRASPLWDRIAEAARDAFPDAALLPILGHDAWDAAALLPGDVTACGFSPLSLLPDEAITAPTDGPGIGRDALRRAAETWLRVVLGTCAPAAFPPEPSVAR